MREPIIEVKNLEEFFGRLIFPGLIAEGTPFLESGKPLPKIGLLPREAFGLCLVASIAKQLTGTGWTIANDTTGRDGVVVSKDPNRMNDGVRFEQVYVSNRKPGGLTEAVLIEIERKNEKGKQYGDGLGLIVFSDKDGSLDLDVIAERVQRDDFNFESCWVIGKVEKDRKLDYVVATLRSATDPIGRYAVRVDAVAGKILVKPIVDTSEPTDNESRT